MEALLSPVPDWPPRPSSAPHSTGITPITDNSTLGAAGASWEPDEFLGRTSVPPLSDTRAMPGLPDPRRTSLLGMRLLSLGRNTAVAALDKHSLGAW
jgi:hypothetical protein